MTVEMLGFHIVSVKPSTLFLAIAEEIQRAERRCLWLACINPHSYVTAKTDLFFRKALLSADWLVADGVGIILGARLLSKQLPTRITGSDVFASVMTHLNTIRGRVFFLGSTSETLGAIAAKVTQDFPQVVLAGTYSPPFAPTFTDAENEQMITAITAANADVLWIGMTAPKQEKWLFQHRERLGVHFAGAIGAVFDYYTGSVRRPGPAFRRLGLEWLPRLLQQPGRLWRRMIISAPIYFLDIIREALRRAVG